MIANVKSNLVQQILAAILLALFASIPPGFADDDKKHSEDKNSRDKILVMLDVTESISRFVFSSEPVFENGLPAYGNAFITQGYIYPFGFLDGIDGVLADGSPSHPEKVLGIWTCRGYFIGDGFNTTSGPIVITTQHFDLFDEPGYEDGKYSTTMALVTEGYELVDLDAPVNRAITGGTGEFSRASGEATQKLLGLNSQEGVKLRIIMNVNSK